MSGPIVTLTTDFGGADAYVGTMKGVILGICPEATLVDISHQIRPQAVAQAAYVLSTAVPYFPPGTVHLVVVDPGVGSERRPIAVQTARATYVAPDNGALSLALAGDPARQAVHLSNPRFHLPQPSATFHGRDIFGPAAAHLARGVPLHDMGERLPPSEVVALPGQQPKRQADGAWLGQVIHVDHFGNLITNHRPLVPGPQLTISLGDTRITTLHCTFADVQPGEVVAYVGSSGYLEIAIREGNAAAGLGLDLGDPVRVEVQS